MITHARQVLHPAAAQHYDWVLLQIMPHARNIGGYFLAVRQPHPGDFTQSRIWFFRRSGCDFSANPALKRRIYPGSGSGLRIKNSPQRRSFWFAFFVFSALADQLINSWHVAKVKTQKSKVKSTNNKNLKPLNFKSFSHSLFNCAILEINLSQNSNLVKI